MQPKARQVFQTESRIRWRTFLWIGRLLLFALLLMIPVLLIALRNGFKPGLPILDPPGTTTSKSFHPIIPNTFNARELKKYKGFSRFLQARQHLDTLLNKHPHTTPFQVRAAFYVDWDPQSFYSLQQNIGRLNMVVPEWLSIDPGTGTLVSSIDSAALNVMRQAHVQIVPLLNNVNPQLGVGEFDGKLLHRILHDNNRRKQLVDSIAAFLQQNRFQGINIDFEDLDEKKNETLVSFQQELYNKLHPLGLLVTQDISPSNEDFDVPALATNNDYLFLMAYDEHYAESTPGPISSQQWIEKVLDETARNIPSKKIILCIAGYGYDWADGDTGETVTYQEAIANAQQYNATIDFDNNTYNNFYSYKDGEGTQHSVYFTDAATNFNTLRFTDEYGTAGTALWRLGSEDPRLWKFYNRPLDNSHYSQKPFDFKKMETTDISSAKPDYIGDGEILNVMTEPQAGQIHIETDSADGVIAEQEYETLPTRYVIRKYGNVNKQVVLTFDDGPDPEYTPRILNILKKENVPAAFFIVGVQAEQNLPLLARIYREGHEIGNHTFTHPNMAIVNHDRALAEMETTRLLIEAITGRSTILFRAPYNADAEPTTEIELKPVALSKKNNYYTVGESIDPEDWEKGISADTIYERVVRQYEANPEKGIILLHDAGGNREATVTALPRIIHYFKSKGIAFTTVSALLHTNRDTVMPPVHDAWMQLNGSIFRFGYWLGLFLYVAFWIAIFLGLGRIVLLGVMASLQRIRDRKNSALYAAPFTTTPLVSIIVPAYNEELNAVNTIRTLLCQDYPNLEILFVDDGSTDHTFKNVQDAFRGNKAVRVCTKLNGGKASALNVGIAESNGEYVVCIDADTQLQPNAVSLLMKKMLFTVSGLPVGAVAGNVKVGNQRTMLTRWQSIEYTTAQNFDRRAFDLVNGITVVPGAIGAFRKDAIEKAGGFTTDTLAEDCDLTIRIIRSGYRVVNCTEAIAVTEAPETLRQFMKQRFRWSYGIMQTFWKHRDTCFNPRYRGLGMIAMPNILLFQILLPLLAPLADLVLIVSLIWNRHDPDSLSKIAFYYGLFLVVDMLVSLIAFTFEHEKLSKLLWLIPQRFVYRQLMYVILFRSVRKAIKGESQGWGVLRRTGNVRMAG